MFHPAVLPDSDFPLCIRRNPRPGSRMDSMVGELRDRFSGTNDRSGFRSPYPGGAKGRSTRSRSLEPGLEVVRFRVWPSPCLR